MELPGVPHELRDPRRQVTYVVLAYRKLSRGEVLQAVRMYRAAHRAKPAKGSRVTIVTTIGAG